MVKGIVLDSTFHTLWGAGETTKGLSKLSTVTTALSLASEIVTMMSGFEFYAHFVISGL